VSFIRRNTKKEYKCSRFNNDKTVAAREWVRKRKKENNRLGKGKKSLLLVTRFIRV
jgi:hypothetical protein